MIAVILFSIQEDHLRGGGSGLLLAATARLLLGRLLALTSLALGAALLTLAGGLATLAGGTACASLGSHDCECFATGA